ncbi:hypothetical protein J6G99_04710 [bacterium]|nr:hypothetical protein [bacterium]
MSKDRKAISIWLVFIQGIKIYFSNIDKFFIYMLFPVFGQLLGLALIFGLTIGFADKIASKTNSISSGLLLIFLLALPGILIFMKAFWDYMVAYVAINSMTEGAVTTGKVYDFQSHREVATRRGGKYILLLAAVGILSLLAVLCCIIPVFGLIPPLILWIYFILVFQVFTFEQELSVKDCFRRSFDLVKGNWARAFILMLVLWFFSIYIITMGVTVIFDYLHINEPLSSLFDFIGKSIPLSYLNRILAHINVQEITINMVSTAILTSIIGMITSELTLPIRSICWTLWYKDLSLGVVATKNIKKHRKE